MLKLFKLKVLNNPTTSIFQLDILLNGELVEEMSTIVHLTKARETGKRIVAKLKETIQRHQFQVKIKKFPYPPMTFTKEFSERNQKRLFQISVQAAVSGKIVAREDIKPVRKDITQKLVGLFGF